MMTFFLLLILFFFVIPLIRGFMTFNRMKRQAREFYGMNERARREPQRKEGWSNPTAKPKRYGRDAGEYVRFEEVSTSRTTVEADDDDTTRTTHVESQVTDVEWEEIN